MFGNNIPYTLFAQNKTCLKPFMPLQYQRCEKWLLVLSMEHREEHTYTFVRSFRPTFEGIIQIFRNRCNYNI